MLDTEAFSEFRKALSFMRDGYSDKALPHIRRAAELEEHNPFYMSYLGVALARTEQKWAEAERLCDSAVRMKRDQPQLYLNLAEVYLAAERKQDAIEALLQGVRSAQRDSRLTALLGKLAARRRPVVPFLERGHAINRRLGQLRHRAMKMVHQETAEVSR